VRRRPSCAVKEATNCDTGRRGDDADRKDAHLASGCGDDWGSACARAAAHAGGEENHVRAGKAVANFLQRLLGRRLADLRPGAGAETLGQLKAHLDISIASLKDFSPNFIVSTAREVEASRQTIKRFQIRAGRDLDLVSSLSGGNQQKVVLGKWFLRNPRVLLLDEPTRGVDVDAKREISRIVGEFAASGGTVAMISSEIDEILGVADRIMVMRDGKSAGILDRSEATAEKLVHLST
jgi:ATPase subunit of ABC transporter with duplicated ATPase domains